MAKQEEKSEYQLSNGTEEKELPAIDPIVINSRSRGLAKRN